MPPMWYLLPYSHCDGQRQSPVNIDTKKAVVDKHLVAFKFKGFNNKEAIENIINTGHTGVNALVKLLSFSLFRLSRYGCQKGPVANMLTNLFLINKCICF